MEPNAYVLREDHPVFTTPHVVDFSKKKQIKVPDAWTSYLDEKTIQILPLVEDARGYPDGWCTYTYEHLQAPELEIICGGTNAKTPRASAIWRQGNLLHFGFEQSPAELNDAGQNLLVNSICYIARFPHSKPIIRRSDKARILDRNAIARLIDNSDRELDPYLDWFFAESLRAELDSITREQLAAWFRDHRDYLMANGRGKFVLDEEAKELRMANDSIEFLEFAIDRLKDQDGVLGRRLLARYAPGGPGSNADPAAWRQWFNEHKDYLFFSDSGGFRWYVDPLAKKRGIPTQELRGAARAE